jgi:hypothetical protein
MRLILQYIIRRRRRSIFVFFAHFAPFCPPLMCPPVHLPKIIQICKNKKPAAAAFSPVISRAIVKIDSVLKAGFRVKFHR